MASTKLYTVEDLLEMDDDGCRYELIDGELTSTPPTSEEHGMLVWRLSGLLFAHHRNHPHFVCFTGDTGIRFSQDRDLVLAPDLTIIRSSRLSDDSPRRAYSTTIPDLVVEVISPSERFGQISTKVESYLDAGVRLIWLVNPANRSITVHAPDQHTRILEGDDVIDGGDVLPDFQLPLAELFG